MRIRTYPILVLFGLALVGLSHFFIVNNNLGEFLKCYLAALITQTG